MWWIYGKSKMVQMEFLLCWQVLNQFLELEKIGEVGEKYNVVSQKKFAVVQLGAHQFKVCL